MFHVRRTPNSVLVTVTFLGVPGGGPAGVGGSVTTGKRFGFVKQLGKHHILVAHFETGINLI